MSAYPQLARDTRHAMIGGVCAGIARRIGLDRWVVRVLTLIAALCAPEIVVVAYIIAWIALDAR